MKALITGAAGMVGGNLLEAFNKSSEHSAIGVTRHDLDLRDSLAFQDLLSAVKPDVVIHAAARVGGIQANIRNPFEFLQSNLSLDSSVIEACTAVRIPNLIYLGSSCMYPAGHEMPIQESALLQSRPEPTNEGYAIAKIAGTKMCEYASAEFGLNYRTLIPSNLYGPRDSFDQGTGHLLASVIRKVHEAKQDGAKNIEVWGTGTPRREFTYVADLASFVVSSLSQIAKFPSALNLGIGKDYAVNDFYRTAMQVMNYEVPLVHDLSQPDGVVSKLMDSSLARDFFGWKPKTDITDGIEMTYRWYLEKGK